MLKVRLLRSNKSNHGDNCLNKSIHSDRLYDDLEMDEGEVYMYPVM